MHFVTQPFPPNKILRNLREFAGISQVEMAQRLEMTQGWLSKLESGNVETRLTIRQLQLLSRVYGISIDDIINGVVNYSEISKKFNFNPIDSKFTDKSVTRIKNLYPFLMAYEDSLGQRELIKKLKKIGLYEWQFCEPNIKVNMNLLWEIIQLGLKNDIFSNDKDAFERIVGYHKELNLHNDDVTSKKKSNFEMVKYLLSEILSEQVNLDISDLNEMLVFHLNVDANKNKVEKMGALFGEFLKFYFTWALVGQKLKVSLNNFAAVKVAKGSILKYEYRVN
jgi:transcriptional regulator with XRE-family HTH domain